MSQIQGEKIREATGRPYLALLIGLRLRSLVMADRSLRPQRRSPCLQRVLLACFVGCFLMVPRLPLAEELVVANPSAPVDALSPTALRAIFSMRLRSWPDGSPVRVFVLPDDAPGHVQFAKQLLSIFPHQLRRAWDRGVYSGTGQAPNLVKSDAAMRAAVANTNGAIGYLPREMVDASVRVIEVE